MPHAYPYPLTPRHLKDTQFVCYDFVDGLQDEGFEALTAFLDQHADLKYSIQGPYRDCDPWFDGPDFGRDDYYTILVFTTEEATLTPIRMLLRGMGYVLEWDEDSDIEYGTYVEEYRDAEFVARCRDRLLAQAREVLVDLDLTPHPETAWCEEEETDYVKAATRLATEFKNIDDHRSK